MAGAWVTRAEAAAIAGCSIRTIDRYTSMGRIVHRSRRIPSWDRASVEEFAAWWRDHLAAEERRRQERARNRMSSPPDDRDVWLDAATAALMLGFTPQWLLHLVAEERVPAVRRGRRWWFRRRHIEQLAAARAFQRATADGVLHPSMH